jgi:hypothetical protein
MKKLFFLLILIIPRIMSAQCPGCIIDTGCPAVLPDGGVCRDSLPNAVFGQPYDQDVTFYMPEQVTQQGVTVNLDQITINGYSGLPQGMTAECNLLATTNGCVYNPR